MGARQRHLRRVVGGNGAGAWLALAVILITWWRPGDAHAQAPLRLSSAGIDVTVPPGAGTWTSSVSTESTGTLDVLTRQALGARVQIFIAVYTNGSTCTQSLENIREKSGVLAPASELGFRDVHPQVVVAGGAGGWLMVTCAGPRAGRLLTFLISHEGQEVPNADLDQIIEVIAAVISGWRSASASGALPPARIERTLPVSGLTLSLAADPNWRVGDVGEGANRKDALMRDGTPRLGLLIVRAPKQTCVSFYAETRGGRRLHRPAYLPAAWHGTVIETTKDGKFSAVACVDVSAGGSHIAQVIFDRSALDPRATTDLHAALTAFGVAAGARAPAVAAATPAPASTSSSTPTAPRSGASSYGGSTSSSYAPSPGPSSYERPRAAADSRQVGLVFHQLQHELGATAEASTSRGLSLAIESPLGLRAWDDSGLVTEAAASLGYDETSEITFDGRAGLGYGIRLGTLELFPVLGIGVDRFGSEDDAMTDGRFGLGTGAYYYVKGAARLHLGRVAVEASAADLTRTGDPDETRLGLRVMWLGAGRKISLEAGLTRYGDEARATTAGLGVSY